jgi:toxin ParE1/3/4
LHKVVWSEEARRDIRDITEYIMAFNPAAASRLSIRLVAVADSLNDFPDRGRPGPYGTREMTTVRPYILRYRVNGDIVEIIHVRHMARGNDMD